MEPMKSVSGLCALLFGLIGGAFVLMGAVFGLLKVPVRGAVHSGWAFVPLGLACLWPERWFRCGNTGGSTGTRTAL